MKVWDRSAIVALLACAVPVTALAVASARPAEPGTGVPSTFRGHERPRLEAFPAGTGIPGLDSLAAATFDLALDRMAVRADELGYDKQYAEDDTFRLAVVEDLMDDPLGVPGFQTELVQGIRDDIEAPARLFARLGRLLAVEPWGVRVRVVRERLPGHILEELAVGPEDDRVRRAATELQGVVAGVTWAGGDTLAARFEGARAGGATEAVLAGAEGDRDGARPANVEADDEVLPRTSRTSSLEGPGGAIEDLRRSLGAVQDGVDEAFAQIPDSLRQYLLMSGPMLFGSEDDPLDRARKGELHFEHGAPADTVGDLDADRVLDAGILLDRAALLGAGRALARTTERFGALVRSLRSERLATDATLAVPSPGRAGVTGAAAAGRVGRSQATPAGGRAASRRPVGGASLDPAFRPLAARIEGDLVGAWTSPLGWIVIGDLGDNVYPADVLAEIAVLGDLGGDDVYRGRVASAVGSLTRSVSILVDADGDDLYDAGGRSFAIGGAVLGAAVLVDLAGDDTYRADTGSLGGAFFGLACLYDGAGRDRFEGRCLTQGAGAFGIGILVSAASGAVPPRGEVLPDPAFTQGVLPVSRTGSLPVRHDENDTYQADLSAQGFGSTFGVGLLYDDAGNDVYRAGGRYTHAPLLPHDFQSLSQGFASGFRPRAGGGVGLLIDEEGNDFYDAEVYAQGTSYWYSLGLLFDGAGNDRYLAAQYAQGAGVHLSVGSLWDRGGDDQYVSRNGVVQGTAHDLAVAFFRDESGDDLYAVSGGQGVSLANGFACFLDEMGDDLYATRAGSRGWVRTDRGFTGAAVFLDLEGSDRYPADTDAADGAEWRTSHFGVGVDLARDVVLPSEEVPEIVLTSEDSLRAVDELFETASLWEVGSAREKVRRARLALVARGLPAVRYAVGEEGSYPEGEPLASDDGLVYRTLREIAAAHPDSFAARILGRLGDPDEQVRRNVIALLGDMKWKPARTTLEARLADPAAEREHGRILQALGKIGDPAAAPAVRPFLQDEEERRRIVAAEALALLRDEAALPALVERLGDPWFTVRSAALLAVGTFGARAVPELIGALEADRDRGSTRRGGGDETLDRVHTISALGLIVGLLADSTDAVSRKARDQAVATLFTELRDARQRLEDGQRGGGEDAANGRRRAEEEYHASSADAEVFRDDPAGIAAAALHGLLAAKDPRVEKEAGAILEGLEAPLLRRAWERRPSAR